MKRIIILCLKFAFVVIFLISCSSHNHSKVSTANSLKSNEINTRVSNLTLIDYLKRIPGVQIMGREPDYRVQIRGVNSLGQQTEPLFIIDGLIIGYGYQNASQLVDPNDIKNIRVLKSGVETAAYGIQGNNGVIIITTKR